jgi:hypothetical protein
MFRQAHRAGAVLIVALGLAIACGHSPPRAQNNDDGALTDVIRTFIREAYEGDITKAYDLIDSDSKALCNKEDFAATMMLGRKLLYGRQIAVTTISDVRVVDNVARARVHVTIDGVEPEAEPEDTVLVRQGGKWRYSLKGKTCTLNDLSA